MAEDSAVFGLTEEQQALREMLRDFVDRRVIPSAARRDAENLYPDDVVPELGSLGVLGMAISEEYGGIEADYPSYAIVFEELGRGQASVAGVVSATASGSYLINAFGTEEQKRKYLPDIAAGRKVSGIALTEPSGGSDLKGIRTVARLEGDHYVVNGSKTLITQARHAQPLLLFVKTNPQAQPIHRGGMSFLIIDQDTPGYTIGQDMRKLGQRGLELNELFFENARVPKENLLGGAEGEGQGFYQMMSMLDRGRIGIAGMAIGIARASFEAATRYANEREAFGQPIGDFQAVKLRIADMATRIKAAQLLNMNAAFKTQAEGRASSESAMAKVFAAETALHVAYEALRIHGGYGYTGEFDVERLYRDAALPPIGEGTNDILNLQIADAALGEAGRKRR